MFGLNFSYDLLLSERHYIKTLTDAELIVQYKTDGDNTYVGELYERYVHLVFGTCMKYLKDTEKSHDAVMHIFEKLLTDLRKHEIQYFKGWLHMVAKNHCLMQLRSEKNVLEKAAEIKSYHGPVVELETTLHPDTIQERERHLDLLEMAIEQLNPEQKTCVRLFFLKDKSYEEIAAQTGFELKAVKSYLQNGKRNLKIYMEKNERAEKHI